MLPFLQTKDSVMHSIKTEGRTFVLKNILICLKRCAFKSV